MALRYVGVLTVHFVLILAFHLNADPDPGIQTNADLDPGQILKSQKVEFFHENMLKVSKRSKKHTYEGTKAFLKGRKPGLFVNFGQYPSSAFPIRIRIRIQDSQFKADPRGSGSTILLLSLLMLRSLSRWAKQVSLLHFIIIKILLAI
jgi:hypothetical protein